jgi:hypothetical protein
MRHIASLFVILSFVGITGSSAQEIAHNRGTQVWATPPPFGDELRIVQEPQLAQNVLGRIDVFEFYQAHLLKDCGAYCGSNTFQAFRDVVPGGMFKWLADRGMLLAMETGVVKPYHCTADDLENTAVAPAVSALSNVKETGAAIRFIAIDESFHSGLGSPDGSQGGLPGACGLAPSGVAQLLRGYVDGVHKTHPEAQVGFIEPYPRFSADQLMSYLNELDAAGVPIPFFHLDLDLQTSVAYGLDVANDVRRISDFCHARGILFGVIVTGINANSDHAYTQYAWSILRTSVSAIGVTPHTLFQSWAMDLRTRKQSMPNAVPDTDPDTLLGQMLGMLQYMKIQPAQ